MIQFGSEDVVSRLGVAIEKLLRDRPGAEAIVTVQPEGYGIHLPDLGEFHIVKYVKENRLTA